MRTLALRVQTNWRCGSRKDVYYTLIKTCYVRLQHICYKNKTIPEIELLHSIPQSPTRRSHSTATWHIHSARQFSSPYSTLLQFVTPTPHGPLHSLRSALSPHQTPISSLSTFRPCHPASGNNIYRPESDTAYMYIALLILKTGGYCMAFTTCHCQRS